MGRPRAAALCALAALALSGCSGGGDAGTQLSAAGQAGRRVYLSNCTACHNRNPARDGALGPAVAGSSRELLEARVVHGTYPPGYTPKRPTQVMVALPHLADHIDELHAYLSEAGARKTGGGTAGG